MDNEKLAKGLVKIAKSILASEKKADSSESVVHFDFDEFFTLNGKRMFEVKEWEPLSEEIWNAALENRKAMVALIKKTLKRNKTVALLLKSIPGAELK